MYRIIKISLLFLLFFSVQGLFGQSTPDKIPNGISIQSVARDASGNAASNRNIFLKVELLQGTATGESVLIETHSVTSNDDGIFNFNIGQGNRVSGISSLISLDWKGKIYFLNIKMAIEPSLPTPGWVLEREYVDLGTSQIWSVPYAFTSYRSIVADSATTIAGILPGSQGGTGVNNTGRTITLGRNFEIQGLGNLKFNTVGPTTLTLPLKGTLVTSESLDTLINKYLLSPTFLGSPKTPTPDVKSNDSSVASTQFVKSVINSEINLLNTKLSSTLDTSAGAKLKIADTSAMLSKRIERDTTSLSNRINLKVNTLNALIDSSLYVKGLVTIDSILTINDSLRVKGNVLIDTNLTVGKDLEIKGNLILNKGLDFNDSLVVQKGARIEQSILAKSKLYVADSVLAKGNVKIDSNLNVGKVTSLNDSLYVKGQVRFDSLLTINDSLRVKGNVLIDSNLTVLGRLSLSTALQFNDSLIVSKGARVDQSILAKSKLYVSDSVLARGNVKIDSNLNVTKVTSLNDSLYVKGQARFDSLLTINDSLRVKGNVLIDSNLTVLGRLSLSTALQFNDSLIVSKGARVDQSILAKSKLYVSDSVLARGNVKIDSNLNVTKVTSLNDSLYVKGQARFDSLLTINDSLRVKGNVLIDTNLTVTKVTSLNDSLYVKGQARFDSLLTINDSLRVKGNVLIDTNLTVNRITTLNDSLIVKGGVRIDQNILAKSKLTVTDSLLAKGNVKIDNNLFVKGRNIDDSIMRYTWSKVNVSDTSSMLADYLRKINDLYSSISVSNGEIANKLAISDTAFLLQKRDTASLSNRINLKLNITDTSFLLQARDTASLSRRIDKLVTGSGDLATTKLNILDTTFLLAKIDTANMLSSRFKRDTANISRRLDLLDQSTFENNALKIDADTAYKYLLKKVDTASLSTRIDALAQSSNVFTSDITLNMGAGKTFGKYVNGETIPSRGKSIDDVIRDIVTLVIHPTYTRPTAGLSMGSSGDFEIGTNLGTLTYSPNFTQNDGGNFTSISYKKNGVEIANNAGTPSVSDNVGTLSATTNYQVTYTYAAGTTVKKNNINVDDPIGMITASTVNSGIITLTPRSYRYWGMTTNSSAAITDSDIRAMVGGSKEFSSSKLKSEFTITGPGGAGPVKYAFYAFPTTNSGTITSIKAGGFESIAAFDVITKDFVNAQGYTVNYTIYVQKNSGTDNVTLIIN